MSKAAKMLPLLFFIASVMFTACSSMKAEQKEEKKESFKLANVPVSETELERISEPAVREIFRGILTNDYSVFRKPFHEKVTAEQTFRKLSAEFRKKFGELKELKYLGTLDAGIFRQTVWKARFARSKSLDEAIRRGGKDPASVPVPDLLIRLYLGNENNTWKVYSIIFN